MGRGVGTIDDTALVDDYLDMVCDIRHLVCNATLKPRLAPHHDLVIEVKELTIVALFGKPTKALSIVKQTGPLCQAG